MAIDWNEFESALQHSRNGDDWRAIALLSSLMTQAETGSDRAAILVGESSCYSLLGNVSKSRELLERAKTHANGERFLMSQIAMCEGSLFALEKKYNLACEKFIGLREECCDLLGQPEYQDFALELDSRLACSLVDAGRYNEAVLIFQEIFKRGELEDRQRLQVFFGFALLRSGQRAEGQSVLYAAAKGENAELSQTALEYLQENDKPQ